jgi:hypothetical protein
MILSGRYRSRFCNFLPPASRVGWFFFARDLGFRYATLHLRLYALACSAG